MAHTNQIARKLHTFIQEGELREVQQLLLDVTEPETIKEIEEKVRKCDSADCCTPLRGPTDSRPQFLPFPVINSDDPDHFMSFESLLGKATTEQDMPSTKKTFLARAAEEQQFLEKHPGTDPINLAIDHRQEEIAIFLVEKAFNLDRRFQWPDENCDQWCYFDHGGDNCPAEYTAVDNAERRNLYKVKNLIDKIKSGQRKPGESLPALHVLQYVSKQPPKDTHIPMEQAFVSTDSKTKSLADEARDVVENHGKYYVTKDGNTLMHLYVRKPRIFLYVFASSGVPVNIQNEKRDTALHIAVREGILDSVEALLQCSADLTIRNAMGMTPVDEADPKDKPLQTMLDTFKPGLLSAVLHGDKRVTEKFKQFWCNTDAVVNKPGVVSTISQGQHRVLERLLKRTWCSVNSVVKEGKTLLQLAESRSQTEKGSVQNCIRLLKDFRITSQLIHAVLCQDVEKARHILMCEKGWSVNYRFRDKIGKTLLSSAIESNNLDIVMLLVENGARFKGVRVREDERSDVTMPLFEKAVNPELNPDIAKYLNSKLTDTSEHMEKDVNGNTPVLRAIECGCPAKFIQWLLTVTNGRCLTDRNKDSLTTKELAQARNREDVVKTIDRFILGKMIPTGIPQFSTHFWKEKDLCSICDEVTGKSLADIINHEDKFDVRKWINFHDVHNHDIRLFEAVAVGNEEIVEKNYDANYKDRNGYTALIRGIVFQQYEVCKYLCMTRPNLKSEPDNCNRYPLHYAYALPDDPSKRFVRLLLEGDPDIEHKVDKDGRCPADYGPIKSTTEIQRMLYDARTLDVYGKRGHPLGPWPKGALTRPPDENQPMEFLEVL